DKATPFPVIDLMPDQKGVMEKGGTMRLGAYPCVLEKGSTAADAYGATTISERHRHRYEVANKYRDAMAQKGRVISGPPPAPLLVEMIELREPPYFVVCQSDPEFKSRPHAPPPLFARFVRAAIERQRERAKGSEKPKGDAPQPSSTVN